MNNAVFFDLDGTLLDTARDFAYAINLMLARDQKPPMNFNLFRKEVYGESKRMISYAYNMDETHPEFEQIRQDFLHTYHQYSRTLTQFFPGVALLLDTLDENKIPWGIITSKPTWLAKPIISHFGLDKRASIIIMGDTLPLVKPDPAPLLYACEKTNVLPENAVYIGDLHTDVMAAKAAGMKSIAVTFGYHPPKTDFEKWNADKIVYSAEEILEWLGFTSPISSII